MDDVTSLHLYTGTSQYFVKYCLSNYLCTSCVGFISTSTFRKIQFFIKCSWLSAYLYKSEKKVSRIKLHYGCVSLLAAYLADRRPLPPSPSLFAKLPTRSIILRTVTMHLPLEMFLPSTLHQVFHNVLRCILLHTFFYFLYPFACFFTRKKIIFTGDLA